MIEEEADMDNLMNGPLIYFSRYRKQGGEYTYSLETMWLGKEAMVKSLELALELIKRNENAEGE